jgi:hypothetical protein
VAAPLARWKRVVAFIVVGGLHVLIWGFALLMFVTGAVMWRDRHALAVRGVPLTAVVEGCKFEPMENRRRITTWKSRGYYSCHYTYSDPGTGQTHRAYFQSPRELKSGDAIPIRYEPGQPGVSATEKDLKYPWLLPAALMLLPIGFGAFHYYRNRRAGAKS